MIAPNKMVLITQNHLANFAGSEMVVLELCEYLLRQGLKVDVYTHYFGNPVKSPLRNPHLRVIDNPDHRFNLNDYGLVWIHHQIIPRSILEQLANRPSTVPFVYHHMSPYEPLEFPFLAAVELQLADLILTNSKETLRAFRKLGLNNDGRLVVFGNPAPDEFMVKRPITKDNFSNLLVVSNHIPKEVQDAVEILNSRGIQGHFLGHHIGEPARLTPQELQKHDLVITIGKTVQYALLSNVPVYCYDHFGGPGFLNEKNFRKARDLNFSGRGFGRKSAEEIANDIITNYATASKAFNELHRRYAKKFTLSNRMNNLFKLLEKTEAKKIKLSTLEINAASSVFAVMRRWAHSSAMFNDRAVLLRNTEERLAHTEKRLAHMEKELDHARQMVESLEQTLGRRSLRLIKKLLFAKKR